MAQVESAARRSRFGERAVTRAIAGPLRGFLHTESGGAVALLTAAVLALVWANAAPPHAYESVWRTTLSIRIGDAGITQDLRHWVNDGLMSFFFLVVGLEARRELEMGQLRDRRTVTVPMVAAVGGMAAPVAIYLAFNAGTPAAHGWGVAMSTDTAFLLGLVALLAPGGTRLRVRLLTLVLFDDLVALVVIATAYTSAVSLVPLLIAIALLGALAAVRYVPRRWQSQLAAGVGVAIWTALYESRVDPVISGLAIGLITSAHLPHRSSLGHAVRLMRSFREQPTPQLARTAQRGVALAISPNERLQHVLHPWTSYVIVPLFALANAGIRVNADLLSRAFSSPVTIGIVVAYVVGKPVGITAAGTLALRLRIGRRALSSPVIAGAGVVAGVGFTVSLLIASIALHGADLEDAKVGILATPILASVGGWAAFRLIGRIPRAMRARQIAATVEDLVDLSDDIDPSRDHIRGGRNAPVTLLEYGDYECPYCGQAEPVVRALLSSFGDDLRYVWRHLPLTDVHPHAEAAAEAAEAAAAQGAFWEMHEKLFAHQEALMRRDLTRYASELGLDTDRFSDDLRRRRYAERVAEDVASADASGVVGTPGFFINGKRHDGAYDVASLTAAVRAARARAVGDYRGLRDPR